LDLPFPPLACLPEWFGSLAPTGSLLLLYTFDSFVRLPGEACNSALAIDARSGLFRIVVSMCTLVGLFHLDECFCSVKFQCSNDHTYMHACMHPHLILSIPVTILCVSDRYLRVWWLSRMWPFISGSESHREFNQYEY